ncbi:ribosomal protein S6 kinase-like 1 isoform X2 [Motacilla alba alba]|uniref:ribosomal protein S6 kinase-like 1 isoform X2 n=1 Tax=Motacilla alba alba TaxID=1094192 RepID=UPI0018D51A4B|nr:ribosomal protein S6 kinase-like 1 isoform X2 [Motacilla alba alba]
MIIRKVELRRSPRVNGEMERLPWAGAGPRRGKPATDPAGGDDEHGDGDDDDDGDGDGDDDLIRGQSAPPAPAAPLPLRPAAPGDAGGGAARARHRGAGGPVRAGGGAGPRVAPRLTAQPRWRCPGGAGRRRGAMSRAEAEPCSRALAQARVYLGQLRGRVGPAGPEGGGRRDYLVEAARQLRLALERDVSEDYEEAFNHYQNGVDVLLRGVQVDPNKERREAVKRKITQYLRRAEEIFNCHLQRAAGGGNTAATGYSSLRFRPIRTLSSAVENLRRCKVVGVIDKVQIVQDPATGETFILKSLPKSHVETRERQTIIPHGVPFMVKLLCYYVSEDSIFLHLEHVQGGTLWSHLRSKYCVQQDCANSNTIQALQDHGTEDGVGSSQGGSQVSRHPVWTGSGLPGSVNYQVLGNTDASLPQEQFPGPTDSGSGKHCQLLLAPAGGSGAAPGGQDLSVTQAVSGVVDHFPAASAKCHDHLASQGLVVYPWNDLTSGTGCISERTASQQGPRLPQRLVPVPKTVRGDQPGAGRLPTQKVSEASQAQPLLTLGERQLPAGVALSSSGKPSVPDPAVGEPPWGASLACGWLSKKPPSGQCRALASHGHNQRAWAVKEEQVQLWAAEILLALEGLHQQGILCRDLNPRNLLLDTAGHVRLTFFGQWTEVEPQYCSQAREELYSAPEVGGIMEPTEAADCWSFGSLLYELLTGVPLSQNHPSGIQPHTQLHLPEGLSLAATSLLTELLQYNPKRRLGSGGGGITKLKSHSFFSTVPWNKLVG